MNRTLKLLMISDIFVVTGSGLIEPIIAIFIRENMIGGSIFSAGLASMIFLLTKSIVQLPFSRFIDKHDDKLRWLLLGSFFNVVVPILYIFARNVNMIYFAQFLLGIGSGLAYPTWLGIWSANLDKRHRSYQWSMYSTLTSLGTAASAAIGAYMAQIFGFEITFVIVALMSLAGCMILFGLHFIPRTVGDAGAGLELCLMIILKTEILEWISLMVNYQRK